MNRNGPVNLDFVRPGGAWARVGTLLLITGLIAAGAAFLAQRHVADELSAREAEVEQLRSISRRSLSSIDAHESDSPEVREQIKRANEVLSQINVPWGELFAAIESAQDASVGLLALVPDPRSHSVQVTGQARDFASVLAYMRRLQATPLKDVVLATHEAKIKEAGQPVEFTLLGRWVDRR